jgi:hypothetical protein
MRERYNAMDKDKLLSFLDGLAYDLKVVQANASQAKADAFRSYDVADAVDALDSVMDGVKAIRDSILNVKEDLEYRAVMERVGK